MSWIADLVMKRLAQRTNVYIVETLDMKRLEQFRNIAKSEEKRKDLFKKVDYSNIIDWDLQRRQLFKFDKEGKKDNMPQDAMGAPPTKQLDDLLTATSTIVIAHYVLETTHVNEISDSLAAWSQDEKLHENRSIIVVFTPNAELFNENLRRLCYEITVAPSTADERKSILERTATELTKAMENQKGSKIKIKISEEIVQASAGLDLCSTETAALQSFFENPKRQFEVRTFTDFKVKILKTQGIQFIMPKKGFEVVGGNKAFKQYITNRVITPLRDPEKARYYGIGIPRGIILVGPPGTGKTFIVDALACEIGIPLASLSSADLLRGIVGQSESRVKQVTSIFESLAPIAIRWDELDEIATPRGSVLQTDSGVSRRVVNSLLEWLGRRDRKSYVIGCTNFPELDPAFIRPGRFDEMIPIFPPDREARAEVLKIHMSVLRKLPMNEAEQKKIIEDLSKETFGWNPAELEKLVQTAAAVAMEKDAKNVQMDHFREAMSSMEVDGNKRAKEIQELATKLRKAENVNIGFLNAALAEFIKGEKEKTKIQGLIESLPDTLKTTVAEI